MTVEASNNAGIAWDRGNPARRCVAKSRRTGERCRRWAIRGGTVCTTHGGSTRHIKRKAQERLDNAADRMARELLGIAVSADSEAVRLAAVRDALDRAGMNPKTAVEVSVAPYEQVLGDLAGVAHVSRAESRARRGIPEPEPPELPEPAALPASDENTILDAEVVPDWASAPPLQPNHPGLQTLEQAAQDNPAPAVLRRVRSRRV